MGHPLPSLCYLPSTSSSNPSAEEIDLFIQSLSKPILLFLYSTSNPLKSTYFNFLNRNLINSWKGKEPELEIYALSSQSSETQRKELEALSKSSQFSSIFDSSTPSTKSDVTLLSDSKSEFTNFLELPTFASPSSNYGKDGKSLKNLILLLRGGQITRLYHPTINDNQENISKRIFEMLIPDEDLAWTFEFRNTSSKSDYLLVVTSVHSEILSRSALRERDSILNHHRIYFSTFSFARFPNIILLDSASMSP